MSTYKEIANRANVSIGTVYRVAHNRGRVAKATEERVRKAIEECGYKRNIYASNLSRQKVYRFGILMPRTHLNSGYWREPYRGAMHAGEELAKYRVETEAFLYDEGSVRSFDYYVRKAADSALDGILIAAVTPAMNGSALERLPPEVPRIYFDSETDDPDAVCFVGQDSYGSGRLAAHLMAMIVPAGATVIALHTVLGRVRTGSRTHHMTDRVRGFVDRASEGSGFAVHEIAVDVGRGRAGFVQAIGDAVEAAPETAGLFISNSDIHLAVDAMSSLGRDAPDRVRYIGYDVVPPNRRYLEDGTIQFLLGQRPFEQGYRGIHLLHRHVVLKEQCPRTIILPTDIITRENVADHE